MRVFVTGASGWIGSATTRDLVAAGHHVIGLARSDEGAARVTAAGADVIRGELDNLAWLADAAADADGVVHLANKHDWANMAGTNATERAAVQTLAEALVGTDKPLLIASGMAGLALGRPSTEADLSDQHGPAAARGGSENLLLSYADRGVRAISARFSPTVHGVGDYGFISLIAQTARARGFSAYVGDGAGRWPAVHRDDAARMVRLGLESAPAGSILHAVAEQGIATRDIAEALGASLGLPTRPIGRDVATDHFGFLGMFFGADIPSSSEVTRALLGWEPTGPSLLHDIADGAYAA